MLSLVLKLIFFFNDCYKHVCLSNALYLRTSAATRERVPYMHVSACACMSACVRACACVCAYLSERVSICAPVGAALRVSCSVHCD